MKTPCCAVIFATLAGTATSADAFEFRCRFVERVGNVDVPIPQHGVDGSFGLARRIRLQFGVFDDAAGPAPSGGFVGWNVGTLSVSGATANSAETRTPGRLTPFNFASGQNANGNPPLPTGDPFTMLTEIDATLGIQSPVWTCDAQGNIPPQPMPIARGINTFVSVFEFTSDPLGVFQGGTGYSITATGNMIAAVEWRTIGTISPPDCGDPTDPSDDIPGAVSYAPVPIPPQAFSCTMTVFVPAPGPGAAMMIAAAASLARRRRVPPSRCI